MKSFVAFTLAFSLLGLAAVLADEQTRNVQTELKSQGFYFGDVSGEQTPEYSAAIRRYQIRNGLEVTGSVNAATLDALGMGSGGGQAPSTPPTPTQQQRSSPAPLPPAPSRPDVLPPKAAQKSREPVHIRREESTADSDRRFLEQEKRKSAYVPPPPPRDHSVIRPPAPSSPATVDEELQDFFAGTPYERAPFEVQENTVRRAQRFLMNRGLYRDTVDGIPGRGTANGIAAYQENHDLRPTGRLDLETLNAMGLLPGRGSNPPLKPFTARPTRETPTRSSTPIRGIWVE